MWLHQQFMINHITSFTLPNLLLSFLTVDILAKINIFNDVIFPSLNPAKNLANHMLSDSYLK